MKKLLRAVYQKCAVPFFRCKTYSKHVDGILYRRLKVDELQKLRKLFDSMLPGEEKDVMYGTYDDSKLVRFIQDRVFIGAFDQELMGVVILNVHAPKTLELGIFVRPDKRKKGLADKLILRAMEFSKSNGMKRIYLRTRHEKIVKCFRKQGFTILGKDKYMTFMRCELNGRN